MADRKYDDLEVGEILKIATQMQSGSGGSGGTGMTLGELQKVAEEVGIDPAAIRRAARELDAPSKRKTSGKADSTFLQQTVEGELSDEGWEELVLELRSFTGSPGKVEITGRTREWIGGAETGSVMLSATSRGGRTKLKLFGDTRGATAAAGVACLMSGVLLPMIPLIYAAKHNFAMNGFITTALMLGIALLGMVVAFVVLQTHRKKFGARVDELLVRLAETAESSMTSQGELGPILSGQAQTTEDRPATLKQGDGR